MNIPAYIKALDSQFSAGIATEHSHRPALKALLESVIPEALVTNEPRQIECGAPDFVLTRNHIPLGYIEAKDIERNLDDNAHRQQLRRYTESLDNLIFTNYLEFRLYRDGKPILTVTIAETDGNRIKPKPGNFEAFVNMLNTFAGYHGQTITTANDLAKRMAMKARMLAAMITQTLDRDAGAKAGFDSALPSQLDAFRKHLIHDIEAAAFADIYAQTVAYGMFAARLHDPTPATFTRRQAAELIPANNPFLRKFFQHIAGYDLDSRIRWSVDDLADLFRAADVGALMKDYGKATQRNDPFLHFYETFLGEYDSRLRKSRGVYYTPEPVVNFIVRAVDEILRTEFGLSQGLADTSKTTIEIDASPPAGSHNNGKTEKYKKETHKVQILDPATGTGTFLAAIVQHIFDNRFLTQKGAWPGYVKNDLIPRLNGFEVLMASYAMAHTKLEMVLRDSGCELSATDRLRIFLTNSLEEHHSDTDTLFAQWLSTEANEANFIKRDTPVMIVVGNPPYAVSSSNKGEWIQELLKDYKKDLNERKLNLDDDYIKFIRYGEYLVEKRGQGVLAYISNNSFLDGITHRQMRKHLLETFDKIYILDLHGNARKRETAPDGSADNNVFDIMQGVSINLFIKTLEYKSALADVFHADLYGSREIKYNFLWKHELNQVKYKKIDAKEPYYFFVPKDFSAKIFYDKGFSVTELFKNYNSGVITRCDVLAIQFTHKEISVVVKDFIFLEVEKLKEKYPEKKNSVNWNFVSAKKDLETKNFEFTDTLYRIFDVRSTVQTKISSGFISRPGHKTMRHMLAGENIGLLTSRSFSGSEFNRIFVTDKISDIHSASDQSYHFPLYIYPDTKQQNLDGQPPREPNLDKTIVQTIATALGLRFTPEKENDQNTFAPIDLLDYIYAVLHSPTYRQRYKEFLKIDFPRVPYPTDKKLFWQLVKLGGELRTLHLLESKTLDTLITGYPKTGSHTVTKPEFKITDPIKRLGTVHINPDQYFTDVPEIAWKFTIGGYQPAQKWLKDRKNRTLTHHDIMHYQKIIIALLETNRLMGKIDKAIPTVLLLKLRNLWHSSPPEESCNTNTSDTALRGSIA